MTSLTAFRINCFKKKQIFDNDIHNYTFFFVLAACYYKPTQLTMSCLKCQMHPSESNHFKTYFYETEVNWEKCKLLRHFQPRLLLITFLHLRLVQKIHFLLEHKPWWQFHNHLDWSLTTLAFFLFQQKLLQS